MLKDTLSVQNGSVIQSFFLSYLYFPHVLLGLEGLFYATTSIKLACFSSSLICSTPHARNIPPYWCGSAHLSNLHPSPWPLCLIQEVQCGCCHNQKRCCMQHHTTLSSHILSTQHPVKKRQIVVDVGRPTNRWYRIHLLWSDIPGHSVILNTEYLGCDHPAVITRTARVMVDDDRNGKNFGVGGGPTHTLAVYDCLPAVVPVSLSSIFGYPFLHLCINLRIIESYKA